MFMGGIVVEDDIDRLSARPGARRIEKADEFEMAMALHAAAITVPSSTLSAANRVVVALQLVSRESWSGSVPA
jgi:hypothetical protein